ncbi:MAG TPA: aminotransferase class III-fold pyridoxal phosphate-dependent enzyme, partial [Desulfobacteraceae bacterium]|nr:aminotransferase class III-fold pyridoxal phosphate-dependent enzyme [Desulfobacteraceae bacterium]
YQAGTLSGNPMAMAAGIATLTQLQAPGFYEKLDRTAERLATGLKSAAEKAGIPVAVDRVGSMMGMFFTDRPVHNFDDAKRSDLERFTRYYQGMLAEGIYLAPSQFEALFVSAAHTETDIEATVAAAGRVMSTLAG